MLMTGCNKSVDASVSNATTVSTAVITTTAAPETTEVTTVSSQVDSVYSAAEEKVMPAVNQAIAMIADVRQEDLSRVSFAFEEPAIDLDAAGLAMYDEMLEKASAFDDYTLTADEHGYDEMDRSIVVYLELAERHPEIENYFVMKDVDDGDMTVAKTANYFLPFDMDLNSADTDELRYETELFDAACDIIVENMPDDLSTYNKYYYLAAVISNITAYDYDFYYGWQLSSAYGAIVSGHSICQGYSRGFMALCQRANLWCEYADGEFDGNSHMWNMVKLDTGTYYVDVTWSDELGVPGSPEWERYFMLTQDELLADHIIYDDKTATGTPL
jgi:transglutaminase/protease-like cytokinesis protein 3